MIPDRAKMVHRKNAKFVAKIATPAASRKAGGPVGSSRGFFLKAGLGEL
jgi:hypothetical protein